MSQLTGLFDTLANQSGVVLFFFMIFFVLITFAVLREKTVLFYQSAVTLIIVLFTKPMIYFKQSIIEVSRYTKRIQDEQREDNILLNPVVALIKVFVGFLLVVIAALFITLMFASMKPNPHWTETLEDLKDTRSSVQAELSAATDVRDQYLIEHPNIEGEDPRITEAKVALEPFQKDQLELNTALQAAQAKKQKHKDSVEDSYQKSKVLGYISDQEDYSRSKVKEIKEVVKSYCSCDSYKYYINAWRALHVAQDKANAFAKQIAPFQDALSEAERVVERERQTKLENDERVQYFERNLATLKTEIRAASKKAGLQVMAGIKLGIFSFFQFLMLVWVIGLMEEFVLLLWNWLNEPRKIRSLLQPQQASPPTSGSVPAEENTE